MRMLLLSLLLLAQTPVAAPTPAPLTELEALRVQNVNLERVIVQRALDDWQKKVQALKADLEKARPGWTWNPETGEWTAKKEEPKK